MPLAMVLARLKLGSADPFAVQGDPAATSGPWDFSEQASPLYSSLEIGWSTTFKFLNVHLAINHGA